MLTIAGGILLAYGMLIGIVIGGGILFGILSLPIALARSIWISRHKKPLPVRHYEDGIPDYFAGSDFD